MIRVLVVDDSATVRAIVSSLLTADPEIQVAGWASNGKLAIAKYAQLRPDVVTLDVEMPEMDGLTTLKMLRQQDPRATVLMLSSVTRRSAMITFEALAAGAVDYVAKPSSGNLMQSLGAELTAKTKAAAASKRRGKTLASPMVSSNPVVAPGCDGAHAPRIEVPRILAVASSTGGPNALGTLLRALPKEVALPVVVVQHMPETFTRLLAERLNGICPMEVHEGAHGQVVRAGCVYLAPGGKHMEVVALGHDTVLRLHEGPPENSCRPAADVLFRSVARRYGPGALAIVLTGMGQDGLRGCEEIHRAHGQILAQDEASSVVWGMPRAVAESGMAQAVLPLPSLATEILRRVHVHA